MDQAENSNFPEEEPDNFEKLLNIFKENNSVNQLQVNQIINFLFSVDHGDILHYQQNFVSFLVNTPQISNYVLSSSEILTLIAIALSTYQISFLDQPIHDSFIQSWAKYAESDDINVDDLFKLAIIFNQLIQINDISRKQLITLATVFIHFIEIDCLSNKFPISVISFIIDTLHFFCKKSSVPEMKRNIISICYHYINDTSQPIKMLIAAKFIIRNYTQYDQILQYITQSLQNINSYHEDSLHYAFTAISNDLYQRLKSCSPWSIYDAFTTVTSFHNTELNSEILEEQVNAMLALNFYGVEKRIDNETDFFTFSITSLSNEKVDVPLLPLCNSFRFSPIQSIRNYQIFTIFFIYSIKTETFLIQLEDKTFSDVQILNIIESHGRNFEYFKSIVNSILFFNHDLKNGMFNTINEFKKPIMNQFVRTMKLFFLMSVKFSSLYEYPKDECTEYDDNYITLLEKFSKRCKYITIIKKCYEILNYVTRRIFEFLNIFPANLLASIYSIYIDLLFNEKANQIYVFVITSFFTSMKNLPHFLNALYSEILNRIENREFIKNAIIFLNWFNKLLKKNPMQSSKNDYFYHSTKNFFIKFFNFTFSTSYTISLHSSFIIEFIKLIKKLFGENDLFKIIPADVLIQLYFNVPSCNKDNKFLNTIMIQFYKSHRTILSKFEWYHKLLLKHAIINPKISIPAIKENNLIYNYRNTIEFEKFSRDLLNIFDTYSSNELRKTVLEMISYIPAKYTIYHIQKVDDISQNFVYSISYNEKLLILNGRQLIEYIREILTCQKPENQFEDFVNFIDFHSVNKKSGNEKKKQKVGKMRNKDNDGLFEIFCFLGLLANSVIDKCNSVEQFLFVQDIFTLIIKFGKNCEPDFLPKPLTPTFLAHFIVSLAINNYSFDIDNNNYYDIDDNDHFTDFSLSFDNSLEFFVSLLSDVEQVLFNVSYPSYHHATFVVKFLIGHFSKSSIDFIRLTKFTVNFILRQLNDNTLHPSHHLLLDDDIVFNLCHFLPSDIFEIVTFLKENVYEFNVIEFLPLFEVKLPFIAAFSVCEILTKAKKEEEEAASNDYGDECQGNKKGIVEYLEEFAEIDMTQIVPLLLLLPEHQERFVSLFSDSLKMVAQKNQANSFKIPYIFCLLNLPQASSKNLIDTLKSMFVESNSVESALIAECLLKALSESKKKSQILAFVKQILTDNGFSDNEFVSNDLSSFEHLFSLFVLQPNIVIEAVTDQLTLLNEKEIRSTNFIDSNFKILVDFLSLPSVLKYLAENKKYKEIGKLLLKIYSSFSFNFTGNSMILYFSFKPRIWSKFLIRNITKKDYLFFFFENSRSKKLSQIVIEIKESTEILREHLQNEYVQFFAIDNSEIPYNSIKDSFMNYFTQKDRYFNQKLISYLVDNGEIWDLVLTILKSKKVYLAQTIKLEILKNKSIDFDSLVGFIDQIPIEYFESFFDFFFDCFHKTVGIELIQSIVSNIEYIKIPLFQRVFQKYSFNFEFDFESLLKSGEVELDELNEYEKTVLIFSVHDDDKINSILDKIDLDSPSYVFKEIEKLVLTDRYPSVSTLMMRFINHRRHFVSILKFVEKNKTTFYENAFELFSNELVLFVSFNLLKTDEENLHENVLCFNSLCSFIPSSKDECSVSHLSWAKKLSKIADSILPVFVKDDDFFHSNYIEFNRNLTLLVSVLGSKCAFVKTYFGFISKFYYENSPIILHELFECVPEIVYNLDDLNEIELNPFISLLCEIVNEDKHLILPYALFALNQFNQKGIGNLKKITGILSLIVKGEVTDIPLSKLNFSFESSLLNSFKNAFCRWFLKDLDTENYSAVMDKIGQKNDLSNWLIFSRSQISDDFNSVFKSDTQYNHFFSTMPFDLISKYRKLIVDESCIPVYYYRELKSQEQEEDPAKKPERNPVKQFLAKKKEEKGKYRPFFKLFSVEKYYNHIVTNTENRIISFKSDPDSIEALNDLSREEIGFHSGVDSCIFQPGLTSKLVPKNSTSSASKKSASTFQLLQDAMTIIGIPKCYPNQIIERLNRTKDAAFISLKSSEIAQFLCLCSLCQNPIVPPYFSRYHSIKLFEDFNRILSFATTKGINVDFSPLEKSEPFISQSQCNLNGKEKVQILNTKENFLISALKNQFNNPHIWADLSAIENDDLLYLFLHSNLLPTDAKKEVLKQIRKFPFRWGQILFDDIKRGVIHESFISLVPDVFRIDYSSVFSPITKVDEIKKLQAKSFFESQIMNEDHPSHNFTFTVQPFKQFFPALPVSAPLVSSDPLFSSFNFPMHSIFLTIEKENASFASVEIVLADGSKVNYLLTAMVNSFSPELFVLSHMVNKVLRKRAYCRSKSIELFSPQIQLITDEEESKLYLVRSGAKPLLKHSIYDDLMKVKREGKYPELKKFDQLKNFKGSKEFFHWETVFLHRFAALSYLNVGLGLKTILPFHLLIDEKNASIQFLQLRKPLLSSSSLVSKDEGERENDAAVGPKIRVFGEMVKYLSPQILVEVLPTAMVNVAVALKFYDARIAVVLNNLVGFGYSERMAKFGESLQNKNGMKEIENLISSSCSDVPITDIPWF